MKKWLWIALTLITVFIAGIFTNHYWLASSRDALQSTVEARKVLYWVAPMNPSYRRDKPGKSPMGMDLVPVYAGSNYDKRIVKISPHVENNLGVKIAKVEERDLSRVIDTVGHVTVDENNIEHIHAYTDGWIKKLYVKTTSELITQGQLLLELYSPNLNNAQEEFLLALKIKNTSLTNASEKKLKTLGMSQTQINQLKSSRKVEEHVKIYATQGGIVSQLNVREGKFIKPDTVIMTIEDLSTIWMIADVFERQANWVAVGQPAIATLPYVPGKAWQGKIDYVYPELDAKTHTLRVRLVFPNPDFTLKPKMYTNMKIFSQTIKNAMSIPRAALIRSEDHDRVMLSLGEGRYKAQSVKIGIESGGYYQVLSGLTINDTVVTSAQFLLDSESNLQAGLDRMQNHQHTADKTQGPQEFVGMGVVKTVDYEKRTVVLDHEPIPALDMPAMTMELNVDQGVHLSNIKQGDHIHFVLIKNNTNQYVVIKIHVGH